MKKIRQLINCNPVVKMPKEVSKRKNMILATEIISTAFFDILSFSIKGAQFAISNGFNVIAIICIMLYFVRDVLQATVQTFTSAQKNRFNEQSDSYIIQNVSVISNIVRGKVLSKEVDQKFSKIMTNSEVILVMKDFIGYIWQFLTKIPTTISNCLTAAVLAIGILAMEFVQNQDSKLTLQFSIILIFCILIFGILYSLRFRVHKKFKSIHRVLRKENEVLFNDVKNIEPLITDEFSYRASLLVNNIQNKRAAEKSEDFKLNIIQVLKAIVLAFFMVSIIFIKLYYVGGLSNLSILVITDILAISSVYSTILNKVANILRDIEDIANTEKDAESFKQDFDNIMSVYDSEISSKQVSDQQITAIQINPFEFSYSSKNSVYTLRNTIPFTLSKGKSYLVHGHTGCGKSTFMHILTGKIKLDESPISYGSGFSRAYLSSIMHESNGRLGSNPVLEELIFSQDTSSFNRSKMVEILKGTHIYSDVKRNLGLTQDDDNAVLSYLQNTTIEQYSSGQKQRLAIVKVLYNLNSNHQIVVFDEATNALDNATAESVLGFMASYCQKDVSRVVFFVTHQVDITAKICDDSITFKMNSFPVFEISSN